MHIERCELQSIEAVHFVMYDLLGAGVSSTSKIDCLGKVSRSFFRILTIFVLMTMQECRRISKSTPCRDSCEVLGKRITTTSKLTERDKPPRQICQKF